MAELQPAATPMHVGIIMDGNGRWAKKRGLPRSLGHKQGATAFGNVVRHAAFLGIPYLTMFAFSTENWSRPAEEVDSIMDLMRSYLRDMDRYKKENIRVRVIGEFEMLSEDIRRDIRRLEENSAKNDGMHLNIALSYGGRDELVQAVRAIAGKVRSGELRDPAGIDAGVLADHLYTAGQPEVDLLIRTSGEQRISNFLLWQSAYAEFLFTDALWPDFGPANLDAALREYAGRVRRMGGI